MLNFEVYKENAEERLSYTSSDTPRTFIRALEDIVKLCEYGQKLEIENQVLQERVQMRQELVEQYEKDVAILRQKVRELETTNRKLAQHCTNTCRIYGNNDCASCPFGTKQCVNIDIEDWLKHIF